MRVFTLYDLALITSIMVPGPTFSHLVLTGCVLHFQSLDWGDPWHSCCSVSLVDAFDVASLSCTVECDFVAPFEVVTSI